MANTSSSAAQGGRSANPLLAVHNFGQSIWLDYIRRDLITSGRLKNLIEKDGLRGMTSNPTIFEKGLLESDQYDALLADAEHHHSDDPMALYEAFALEDIRQAADVLWPVYESARRADGYVSLEVSPYLAHDGDQTATEVRRLWNEVDRANLMIKIPGTTEGLSAIQRSIAAGINVNVTLLFDRQRYEEVAEAYLSGLEAYAATGGDLSRVASVASFFVSRIDSAVDSQLQATIDAMPAGPKQESLRHLLGKVAIANAKLAYHSFQTIFSGPRWQALERRGAHVQRLLWASTGTKNPAYRDVLYVEELIGPRTVNTLPPATLDAFRDHGRPRASLEENVTAAEQTMAALAETGISLKAVTNRLLDEGVQAFWKSFDKLLAAVVEKRKQLVA